MLCEEEERRKGGREGERGRGKARGKEGEREEEML